MLPWRYRMKHHLDFEKPIIELQRKLDEFGKHPETHSLGISVEEEVALIEKKIEETRRQIFYESHAWDRDQNRSPSQTSFHSRLFNSNFTDFSELHGDRLFCR